MNPDDGEDVLVEPLPQSLRGERGEALLHGLDLLRRAWADFDVARPYQPAISEATRALIEEPLREHGTGVASTLDAAAQVLDESLSQSRPRYFGYIGSSGLESAVLADAMATSHDVNMAAETAAAQLVEQQTLHWVGQFVGYPAAGGTFTSGGMLSNLTALMAARTRALPESRARGLAATPTTVYASAESHSSVERAAEVLGIGRDQMRGVPVDDHRRMDVAALRRLIAEDRAAGFTPIAVVATAGTTLTGAVDPIDAVADVCAAEDLWLHVDGAYGLPAARTPEAGHLFAGLDRADSASVDAHKWMFVPKACGVLMLREPDHLRRAFRHDASYMVEEQGFLHPVEGTLEYSRPFRSLKLWAAFRAHGSAAFLDAISENLHLAVELRDLVRDHPRLELLIEQPDLTVVPFRRVPAHGDVDEHNMRLARAMQADGRVYVTSAIIDGRSCLRPCIVNFRTTREDIHALIKVADEVGARLEDS